LVTHGRSSVWCDLSRAADLLGHLEDLSVVRVHRKDVETILRQGVGLTNDRRDVVIDSLRDQSPNVRDTLGWGEVGPACGLLV
jgi:hypothetical protein